MRFLAAAHAVRTCALALWLGCTLAMLAVILLTIRYSSGDLMQACEIVNKLIVNAGKARLVFALAALAAQALLFFNRSAAAPSGWRRFVPALLVMAALAGGAVSERSLYLMQAASYSADAAAAGTFHAHLRLAPLGLNLLVLETLLVAAALLLTVTKLARRQPNSEGK